MPSFFLIPREAVISKFRGITSIPSLELFAVILGLSPPQPQGVYCIWEGEVHVTPWKNSRLLALWYKILTVQRYYCVSTFLWKKRDKLKRKIIIGFFEEGQSSSTERRVLAAEYLAQWPRALVFSACSPESWVASVSKTFFRSCIASPNQCGADEHVENY